MSGYELYEIRWAAAWRTGLMKGDMRFRLLGNSILIYNELSDPFPVTADDLLLESELSFSFGFCDTTSRHHAPRLSGRTCTDVRVDVIIQ